MKKFRLILGFAVTLWFVLQGIYLYNRAGQEGSGIPAWAGIVSVAVFGLLFVFYIKALAGMVKIATRKQLLTLLIIINIAAFSLVGALSLLLFNFNVISALAPALVISVLYQYSQAKKNFNT